MEVTRDLVLKMAHLSKLHFTEEEIPAMQQDLQSMISFVEKLQEVNTDGVEPLQHMGNNDNILREDVVKPTLTVADALDNAPLHNGTFFKVPKVIKK